MPTATTHSVEVNAPLHSVYNQWTQFEEFPSFMEGVEEVRQEGDKRLFWRSKIAGTVKEWEAEITHQVPDERIAWTSTDGSSNSGTVTFQELGPDRTRVTATIAYEPEGLLEKTGDALGIPSGRVQADLERFRTFIEERGRETGGWRGEIEGEKTADSGSVSASRSGLGFDKEVGEKSQATEAEGGAAKANREQGDRGTVAVEVPLSEEEVKVGKRTVGAGEIKLHKKTTTEKVNVPVELKREDAVIERVSGEEIRQGGKDTFQEQHIEVPLSREEPVVEKETHVTGGVRVRKTEGTEQTTIQEITRREDVDVDQSGQGSRKERNAGDPCAEEEQRH
jgi:uncharacterized protein (TIGR02271 family)